MNTCLCNGRGLWNKQLILFLVSFVLPATFVSAQPNEIRFSRISTDMGLSYTEVTAIVYDHRGFMWFGTKDGRFYIADSFNHVFGKKELQRYLDEYVPLGLLIHLPFIEDFFKASVRSWLS